MDNAYSLQNGEKTISIGIRQVAQIDFASTMLLNAIEEELAVLRCNVSSKLPKEEKSRKYLIESGYLNKKYVNGRMIINPGNTLVMDVQRGEDRIKVDNIRAFIAMMEKVYQHLHSSKSIHHESYVSILKEICSNSAEWGNIVRRNWTIGVKFEEGKAIFVALDLGQGILKSLYRNFYDIIADMRKPDWQILEGAFNEHYGSKSKEDNRNQGLPFIKQCSVRGIIKELCVISNNVMLDFTNSNNNCVFSSSQNVFPGTLYSWVIDASCLTVN